MYSWIVKERDKRCTWDHGGYKLGQPKVVILSPVFPCLALEADQSFKPPDVVGFGMMILLEGFDPFVHRHILSNLSQKTSKSILYLQSCSRPLLNLCRTSVFTHLQRLPRDMQ